MKNLQLTKLGFLLFLVLLCGCSDSFVIDTPAEAGNSYESDVHVLNKFVDISEPTDRKTAWVLFCGVGYFSAASFNWLVLDSYDNRISWNFTGESMLDETMLSIAQMVFFK